MGDVDTIATRLHGRAFIVEVSQLAGRHLGSGRAVGPQDAPPGDLCAPCRHHPGYSPRPTSADVLCDVAVGHHPSGRDRVDGVEDPPDEIDRFVRRVLGRGVLGR